MRNFVISKKSAQEQVIALAREAGITIHGDKPWDIAVHNDAFYSRLLAHGSLGLGESYMDGWWDTEKLDEFFTQVLRAKLDEKMTTFGILVSMLAARIINKQNKVRSQEVAEKHYDLSNDFYVHMLDKEYMQYTCAYWKDAATLEQAQVNKLDLICKKLRLKSGERLLELGCGWGGLAKYAARHYGVSVVAYNISKAQVEYARKSCAGLPVEIVHDDYRAARGSFDKVVSVGMCEHVGYKNYASFMRVARQALNEHGLFLVHTIGGNVSTTHSDPWLTQYIFPGSMLPSVKQLGGAFEKLFVLEDWHNFGADYDRTLMAWHANFEKNWHLFAGAGVFNERFHRMWKYYLLSCAGLFRARHTQLWQIVLSKNGVSGGYTPVR